MSDNTSVPPLPPGFTLDQPVTPPPLPSLPPGFTLDAQVQGQGDHGYAPAPPETPAPSPWETTTAREGSPEELPPTLTLPSFGPSSAQPPPNEPPPPRWEEPNPAFASGDPRESLPPAPIVPKVESAMAEGWRATPSILTPEGEDALNKLGPLFRQIINPGLKVLNVPLAAGNALMYGGAEIANQVTGDQRAGRDFLQALQVAPMASARVSARGFDGPRSFQAEPNAPTPPGPRFVSERFAPDVSQLDPRNAIQTLIEHDTRENPPPAADRGASNQGADTRAAPAEAPGPRSAGAAGTPFADAALTPEQAASAGSTADKQWLYQTAVPGEADNTVYLKGITPTMAQREQTVNAARDSKLLRRISPDAEQAERALLAEHTDIRKGEFQDIAGSDVTHEAEMKAASDQIETQLQAAYAHGGTVDLQPVIAAANAELRGSAGKLPPVKAAMKAIVDAAEKSDGSGLETDPRQANAVRRAIIYMQSREGKLENPGYGHPDTLAALTRVKDVLTKQVEPAAPGFTEANTNYARARQATDAREALQAYEPKLYDGLGNMRYQAFHRMMGDIVKARDPNAPLGPYKALTEEQMNRLKSVHDDLKRAASAEDLARANGSDTTQTLFDLAKRAARHATGTGAGAVVGFGVSHILGPEAGMAAGMFTKDAVTHMFEKGAIDRATAEHNKLLHPDPAKYPTRPNPMFNTDGQY